MNKTAAEWLRRAEQTDVAIDDHMAALAGAIDTATDSRDMEVLKSTDDLAAALSEKVSESPMAAELAYMRANAWSARRYICKYRSDDEWDWEGEEIEHELFHLREAAYHPAFVHLDPMRQCQIETNLGNLLNHVGRFVDAVTYWDRAIERIPKFAMANANRGIGLGFSDRGVLLYNTLDYPSHSLAVERIKCAFRTSYSLFDKIGQFVNHYWRLGMKRRDVTLRRIWCESLNNERKLRQVFRLYPNWPLRGLFWLSRDLFDEFPGFRNHTEPDARDIATVRHRLEHGFLRACLKIKILILGHKICKFRTRSHAPASLPLS
ncbi:LA2681 family HEPN domain-containing protein [Candidatus Thiosymbion oneisti]|uniref:LA2681 family HEPN domain-containing protein n=1 Tax=Candidatus Thiosymbion oneisti TaxID=589554 RepID=UPI000B7F3453|nr:LA2681 family HEPN domain-containing protein [Candidatus Thiosymbion oneisti]